MLSSTSSTLPREILWLRRDTLKNSPLMHMTKATGTLAILNEDVFLFCLKNHEAGRDSIGRPPATLPFREAFNQQKKDIIWAPSVKYRT